MKSICYQEKPINNNIPFKNSSCCSKCYSSWSLCCSNATVLTELSTMFKMYIILFTGTESVRPWDDTGAERDTVKSFDNWTSLCAAAGDIIGRTFFMLTAASLAATPSSSMPPSLLFGEPGADLNAVFTFQYNKPHEATTETIQCPNYTKLRFSGYDNSRPGNSNWGIIHIYE